MPTATPTPTPVPGPRTYVVRPSQLNQMPSPLPGDRVCLLGDFTGTIGLYGLQGLAHLPITIDGTSATLVGNVQIGSTSQYIVLTGLTIHDARNVTAVQLGSNTRGITVSRCVIFNIGYHGIYSAGSAHIFDLNVIHHTGLDPYPYGTHPIYISSDDTIARQNHLYKSMGGNGLRIQGVNVRVEDNIVHDNLERGITVCADIPTRNVSIFRNDVYNNPDRGIAILGGKNGNVPTDIYVTFNHTFANGMNIYVSDTAVNVVLDGNVTTPYRTAWRARPSPLWHTCEVFDLPKTTPVARLLAATTRAGFEKMLAPDFADTRF
jgi:hypothetical protein